MEVKHFVSTSGKDVIIDFIRLLPNKSRLDCADHLELLENYGFILSSKYIKKLSNKPKLWELRIDSKLQIRFIFTVKNNCAIVLHGFIKKTQKIRHKELILASKRLKQI